MAEFLELLDDHDDFAAEFGAEQRHADEIAVFIAIADDQAADLVLQGEAGEQFGFAAHFEPEIERLAGVEDFLDDFAELVDLDGEDAAVFALVIVFRDGTAEGEVDGLDAVAEDVLEPDEHREFESAAFGLLDDIRQVHRSAGLLQRPGHDVAGFVDVEVFRPPSLNVVEVSGGLEVPAVVRVSRIAHRSFESKRTIGGCAQNSIRGIKLFLAPGEPFPRGHLDTATGTPAFRGSV